MAIISGCGSLPGKILPNEATEPIDPSRFELVARFVHISDAQIVDEESPGRLIATDELARRFGARAWRPQESYSTQLLDGTIRAINKLHVTSVPIDFVIHTGDATDNVQINELQWFVAVFDGEEINPRSGPDDRSPNELPDPLLDPHAPFRAQGLYQHGRHGPFPTIPWYSLPGNHDHFAAGTFPIVTDLLGRRTSPLPLQSRFGLFLPRTLDPAGSISVAAITPADPGPPPVPAFPVLVQPNPDRRFFTAADFIEAHLNSTTQPHGHGFSASDSRRTWFSVLPAPGVRLIALNSSTPIREEPTLPYPEGAVSLTQRRFLEEELVKARRAGEIAIVASHHPAGSLEPAYGTGLTPRGMIDLLNRNSCVALHLAGHLHENVVIDRGGYLEMVTGSLIDAPQQGRVVEIWRAGAEVVLRYWMFSHLDHFEPIGSEHLDLFADPLRALRETAARLAGVPLPAIGQPRLSN